MPVKVDNVHTPILICLNSPGELYDAEVAVPCDRSGTLLQHDEFDPPRCSENCSVHFSDVPREKREKPAAVGEQEDKNSKEHRKQSGYYVTAVVLGYMMSERAGEGPSL